MSYILNFLRKNLKYCRKHILRAGFSKSTGALRPVIFATLRLKLQRDLAAEKAVPSRPLSPLQSGLISVARETFTEQRIFV